MANATHSLHSTAAVYAVATMDTKAEEIEFVAARIRSRGIAVRTIDVGAQHERTALMTSTIADKTFASNGRAGENPVSPETVASFSSNSIVSIRQMDRGSAVTAMSSALTEFLLAEHAAGRVAGVIGIGGSGGTAIVTSAMRMLPIGLPKLMVSTVASGNTAPYVDCSDICMMYSVVDVAGLNTVSVRVLSNAANAIAGMVTQRELPSSTRPSIAMTMFGVTTTCVTHVRKALEDRGYDCLVFHATGTGGRAMEKLVESGLVAGVLDITTTEVADEVVGGVFPSGPQRFDAILKRRIPYVLSVGALDMVNFGAKDTVPEKFRERQLHVHNAQVTLMRTTESENREFARWIAAKLNQSTAPITVLIPELGISALDAPGQAFHNPAADAALFTELQSGLRASPDRKVVRLPLHINDEAFATALVEEFLKLCSAHAESAA